MEKYIHYKNGKTYKTVTICKLQENGEWKEGIIYSEVNGEELYVRNKIEFFNKFKLVEE